VPSAALFPGFPSYLPGIFAGRRRPPKAYYSRLTHSPVVLSREFLPTFLPVGKNFAKEASIFLPVGKPGYSFPLFDPQLPSGAPHDDPSVVTNPNRV